jgi:GDPmannose 4,6-dehydratase
MTRALICGISGQDGGYLAKFLLNKGYEVWGSSRDAKAANFTNLAELGILDQVKTISMTSSDFRSVHKVITQSNPDEIYNLSGQSSVGLSFEQPTETLESIVIGTLNLLEVIRSIAPHTHFYNAGSGECFGDIPEGSANEETSFHPQSPYAIAKVAAYWLVANYRLSYGLFACTGILFNHESPMRPTRFVTQKIIQAAIRISQGSSEKLTLGDLRIYRDWGWSPEYVEAMWKMLQQSAPEDFVISTGELNSLETFVQIVFDELGLDWHDHVISDPNLFRPNEIKRSVGNSTKAYDVLKWRAQRKMNDVIKEMIKEGINRPK